MSDYKRGGKWWVQYYEKVEGQLKKHCVGGWDKKSEAKAEDVKIKSMKKEGKRVLEKRKSFVHTFDELVKEYRKQFKGQKYFKDKYHHLEIFEKFFSGKKLGDIGIKI